jgi:lysophospholipase L1-like esterase
MESVPPQSATMNLMRRMLLMSLGLAVLAASCNRDETPTTPTPTPTPSNEVFYSALAASDGIGFGGSAPCVPFDPDCPNGTGYVYVIKRRFQSDGRTVSLSNRSLPGAVLSSAIQSLARDIGRNDIIGNFIDQIVPFVPGTSTHITIFAGGNDANVIAQAVRAGRGGSDVRGFIDAQLRQWATDVEELVRRLRARAPNARIVAFNLPNLAGAPYLSRNPLEERSVMQRIAVGLSDRVNTLTSQNVQVADLMCDARVYDGGSFATDGFHPNDRGYALIAELGYPRLSTGAGAPPSSTCPQRTLVPAF